MGGGIESPGRSLEAPSELQALLAVFVGWGADPTMDAGALPASGALNDTAADVAPAAGDGGV